MKVLIHPTLYAYLIALTALSSWKSSIAAGATLLIHEAAHYLVSVIAGESISRLELTPLGGMMAYAEGKAPKKGISGLCIAAAGPAANYAMLLFAGSRFFPSDYELQRAFVSASFTMLCVNLLPALPLDGGRIVFCLGYYVFPVSVLISLLTGLGIVFGFLFLLLAIYGAVFMGKLNCSMVIVGIYLICCAKKCRVQMITENLYVVLQEAEEYADQIQRMKIYQVPSSAPLHRLIQMLNTNAACVFVFEDARGLHSLSGRALCQCALSSPSLAISEAFYNTPR